MNMEFTFLGTGTSQGIPIIGCDCAVCCSDDLRDKRMRTSALVGWNGRQVLIDATPELRLQCLHNDVRRIDAVLITHTHADHIFGLDDVRRFNQLQNSPIDLYAAPHHLKTLDNIFGYTCAQRDLGNRDIPRLVFHTIDGGFGLYGLKILPLILPHGRDQVLGFRLGPLAYCTDVSDMPTEAVDQLQGLELLVLGALRPRPHPKHLSIDEAVAVAQTIGAHQTYFVHMSHQIAHQEQEHALPENIHLAYDGLKLTCDGA